MRIEDIERLIRSKCVQEHTRCKMKSIDCNIGSEDIFLCKSGNYEIYSDSSRNPNNPTFMAVADNKIAGIIQVEDFDQISVCQINAMEAYTGCSEDYY